MVKFCCGAAISVSLFVFLLLFIKMTEARISQFSAIQENLVQHRGLRNIPVSVYSPIPNPMHGNVGH
ncbi:hypothetical protein QYF36_010274 [Acer negundo]|nr:hypothetical protein QYF36_010274 [Acer negundo]